MRTERRRSRRMYQRRAASRSLPRWWAIPKFGENTRRRTPGTQAWGSGVSAIPRLAARKGVWLPSQIGKCPSGDNCSTGARVERPRKTRSITAAACGRVRQRGGSSRGSFGGGAAGLEPPLRAHLFALGESEHVVLLLHHSARQRRCGRSSAPPNGWPSALNSTPPALLPGSIPSSIVSGRFAAKVRQKEARARASLRLAMLRTANRSAGSPLAGRGIGVARVDAGPRPKITLGASGSYQHRREQQQE
jgi:hypothetical protein